MSDGQATPPSRMAEMSPPTVPPELQRLDPKVLQVAEQYFLQAKFHSGPLPPAEDLADYESACAGAAKEIIEMAKAEQAARIYCMRSEIDAIKRGQQCAIGAFGLAMTAACVLAYLGAFVAASAVGGGAITVFGGAFILARHFQAAESKAPPREKETANTTKATAKAGKRQSQRGKSG